MNIPTAVVVVVVSGIVGICSVAFSASMGLGAQNAAIAEVNDHKSEIVPHPAALTPIQLSMVGLEKDIESLKVVVLANQDRESQERIAVAVAIRNLGRLVLEEQLPIYSERRDHGTN